MSLVAKLSQIQGELKSPKSQTNNFGKYKYRSCEDILESVKPHLQTHGLILTLSDLIVNVGDRYYIEATAKLTDGKDVVQTCALAREPISKKGADESQITGTASSYARKYALNGLFCIDDTKDADTMDNKKSTRDVAKEIQQAANKGALTKIWNSLSPDEKKANTQAFKAKGAEIDGDAP